jgi:hypothetical protein
MSWRCRGLGDKGHALRPSLLWKVYNTTLLPSDCFCHTQARTIDMVCYEPRASKTTEGTQPSFKTNSDLE